MVSLLNRCDPSRGLQLIRLRGNCGLPPKAPYAVIVELVSPLASIDGCRRQAAAGSVDRPPNLSDRRLKNTNGTIAPPGPALGDGRFERVLRGIASCEEDRRASTADGFAVEILRQAG